MELDEWLRWYDKIRARFGYSIVNDQNAARVLSDLIKDRNEVSLYELNEMIKGKDVIVFGAGPSLEEFKYNNLNAINIACDGASKYLLENKIRIDLVVTDLDGDHGALLNASKQAIMVVHAHEDNVNLMLNLVPKFKRCIATTQVKPLSNVYNFGGFTDGDRAVFLAEHFNARRIILVGMDFGVRIGRYSKEKVNASIKIAKMEFAKALLEYLADRSRAELYNASNSIIKGFKNIGIEDIGRLLN